MSVLKTALRSAAVVLFSVTARAADGGPPAGDAGGCTSSVTCARPTPYCQPSGHVCVECLTDRNCSSGVCDIPTGKCTDCLSDRDCSGRTPYCDKSAGRCAECLSDGNCGNDGIKCTAGVCGSCGDGICGPREIIFGAGPPGLSRDEVYCPEDCAALCPTEDIGSAFGAFTVDGTKLRNLYGGVCGASGSADAMFEWTAPYAGTFMVGGSGIGLAVLSGGCGTEWHDSYCNDFATEAGAASIAYPVTLTEGATLVALVDSGRARVGALTFFIQEPSVLCPPGGCVSSDASSGRGPGATEGQCLERARARGESACSGLDCACNHCPAAYDDCASTASCSDLLDCMHENDCVATACYNSGVCRSLIDSHGGVSGAAFRASAGVQSCELTFGCALPCGADGGSLDGSVSTPKTDAGRLCAPGRTVVCTCEGGTGTKVCADDGQDYGPCDCSAKPAVVEALGCDCHVSGEGQTSLPGLSTLALGVAAGLVRRRLHGRSNRRR